jgi:hypothetical protein
MRISREKGKILRFNSGKRIGTYFISFSYVCREEMFKQKRAFTGEGATNTPAGASQHTPSG